MPEEQTQTIVTVPASSSGSGESGLVKGDGHPIRIEVIPVWKVVIVRTLRAFIDAVLGSTTITTFAPSLFNVHGFFEGLKIVLISSAVVAGIAAARTISELLAKWDQAHPTLSA